MSADQTREADGQTAGAPESAAGHPDVLQILDEFDQGLKGLQALYAQRKALEGALTTQRDGLAKKQAELEARAREAEEQLAAARRLEEQCAAERSRLEKGREELEELSRTIEAKMSEIDAAEKALATRREELEKHQSDLDEAARIIAAEREAAKTDRDANEAEMQARTAELEAQRANLEAQKFELEAHRAKLDAQKAEIEARKAALDAAAARKVEASKAKLDELTARAESAEKAAAEAKKKAEQDAAMIGELRRELEASKREREAAVGRAADGDKDAAARMQELAERLAAAEESAEEHRNLWEIERAQGVKLTEELTKLREEAGEAETVISTLREKLKTEAARSQELTAKTRQLEADLAQGAALVAELEGQLAELRKKRERVQSEARSVMPESLERRRRRLTLARELVRRQAAKVKKGGEALRKRYEQCEQVLSQRAELAEARAKIIAAEKRAHSGRAVRTAAVVMLCGSGVVAMLGGLSWAAATHFAPATFVASSQIGADGRGRELQPAELDEWQRFHEGLIADPMFHDAAADRFKRQGMTELARPADLAQRIREGLSVESGSPGEMTLRWTGKGADRSQRELETLTASLTSHANAAQTRRIDGGVTKVLKEARAGDAPIDNTRTVYALGILGGTLALALAITLTLWRKLSRAKTDFERDTGLASTLDPGRWPDPARM